MLTAQTLAPWLPAPGTAAVCAVSGGLDSMCLLHLLWIWCGENGVPLTAAHFHHGLRDTADRDETFVRRWCGERKIPFTAGHGDARAYALQHGLSLEEAARELRYRFLRRVAAERSGGGQGLAAEGNQDSLHREPPALIYTAHHAGDNAETVLLNLLRGTGITGLCGMRRLRDGIVRPFLDVARADLKEYAAAHGVPHVEDETNADPSAATRNRVRLDLLPLLRELNPKAEEHIRAAAAQLAEIDGFLEEEARWRLETGDGRDGLSVEIREERAVFPLAVLLDTPPCLRPRMLLLALDRLGVGRKDFRSVHLNAVLSLLGDGPARHLDLPRGVMARCSRDVPGGVLVLERRPRTAGEAELRPGVPVLWGAYQLTLMEEPMDKADTSPQGNCLVIRNGPKRLAVSRLRPADRLRLPGASGSRTVKRLCLDRRISIEERDCLPAVYADGHLAAVYRLGTDAAFLPAEGDVNTARRILVETV